MFYNNNDNDHKKHCHLSRNIIIIIITIITIIITFIITIIITLCKTDNNISKRDDNNDGHRYGNSMATPVAPATTSTTTRHSRQKKVAGELFVLRATRGCMKQLRAHHVPIMCPLCVYHVSIMCPSCAQHVPIRRQTIATRKRSQPAEIPIGTHVNPTGNPCPPNKNQRQPKNNPR